MARIRALLTHKRAPIVGLIVAGLVALTGAAAVATRSAGDYFANAALDKLGGDSEEILDSIAERVVTQLVGEGGAVDEAQAAIVEQLAGAAGDKLATVDTQALLDTVQSEVVTAGLGKIDSISTDAIVAQVTEALIDVAGAEIDQIDLSALATSVLNDLTSKIDLNALVNERLADLDIEGIVAKVITDQLASSGQNGGLGNLLGLLF